MPVYTGNDSDNTITGSNKDDTIYGLGGNDDLSGGNGSDTISGGSGNDVIDGGNGADSIDGGEDADVIRGGSANDILHGGGGDDQLEGENGNDHLGGAAGDDLIDGGNGFDLAHYTGLIEEYTFLASAGYLHVVHQGGAGPDGHDRLTRVERLIFANRVVDIGSGHNAPGAADDHVFINEDTGIYSSGSASVLDNDFDFDGDSMTVASGTFSGTYGTLTLNSDGTYSYTLSASAQTLAQDQNFEDLFNYTLSDDDGSDTGTLVFHIAGVNDAPTANPDGLTAGENEVVLIDVLANDADVDSNAVLTVTAASAPSGQGTASVVGDQVQFDPGTDFDDLAAGETENVVVDYEIKDEHGATASSTVTITVTGANDAPVANPDTGATDENSAILIAVLANDTDSDNNALLAVTAASASSGQGSASVVGDQVKFDPGTDFDDLAVGETANVVVSYDIEDEHGASSSSTVAITVTGTNDGPVAHSDTATTGENSAVATDVLANDDDVDNGAVLTVTAASAPAGQGTASVVNNNVEFDPGSDFEALAAGENADVLVGYDIADEHGATASSTLTVTVTGENDGPLANADTSATSENATVTIDAVANDTDVDNNAVLTVTAASAPAGQGTASVVADRVEFDPGADFDDLAVGESEVVAVSYSIEDEHGASSSSTITITVSGANDGPVANPDVQTTGENSAVVINVLANDTDVDNGAVLTVVSASAPAGKGTVTIVENEVRFDPGTDFAHLGSGESEVVVVSYTIEDEHGAAASSNVTITVLGREEGTSNTGTDEGETLVGTPGNDTLDALGGDDTVYGLAGDDLIYGGDGSDVLFGDEDNDTIEGGDGEDFLQGGEGNDSLSGQAGNDNLAGENGADQLAGGDGFDFLDGGAGNDVLAGGNDDDFMSGGDGGDQMSGEAGNDGLSGDSGNDQLSGGADNDTLDGGEGDDTLTGGDGDDYMTDFAGTNIFAGGLGHDQIFAGASDGAQTIDGGDGNDSIRHYGRSFASTITTGGGSDTIELTDAHVGTAAIVVTDFTAGAGGDVVRLSGDGGVLSLLTGWNGSSNPFGSGFLRLQQSGADTLLQWDRNGATGGSDWETLAVFRNAVAGDFTEANFAPRYDPDGSAPAGQTITGTAGDDELTGTIGADTINALAGDDRAFGGSGADTINGGDGFDQLRGDADNDVIDGGNDDDFLWGGDGADQLSGQAGNDALFGESGNDQLSGGVGNDSLDGGDDDDTLTGGDGDDYLSDFAGTNSFAGGLGHDQIFAGSSDGAQAIDGGDGNDSIRHYGRSFASTITTGGGSDTIELTDAHVGTAAIVVTDFTAGAGGDVVRLSGDGGLLSLLRGWDGSSNPFQSGFLRLQQSGADTLLQWDQDGGAGGSNWETLAVFRNAVAGDFTEANFAPRYDPDGSAPAGQTITGTAGDDTLTGTIGADTIDALAGEDKVFGGSGADTINGGDGFDQLRGDADNDVIDGGNDDDYLWGGDGNDQISGQSGGDTVFGEDGNDQLAGGAGDDSLDGGAGADSLTGGDGDDFMTGGPGSDTLTGGLGVDFFNFRSASHGADAITDFVTGTDWIRVSASGFGGGLTANGSVSLVSGTAPTASAATGQFLYDTDDGRLLWDVDGTGSVDPVLVATFSNIPALVPSDFYVVG